jgi:hypothetical protein
LDPTPLSITELMHMPIQINAKERYQLIATFRVGILKAFHHFVHGNVGHERNASADKGNTGHTPIAIQIGAMKIQFGIPKGIEAQDFAIIVLLGQMTTGEDAKQSGFATKIIIEDREIEKEMTMTMKKKDEKRRKEFRYSTVFESFY